MKTILRIIIKYLRHSTIQEREQTILPTNNQINQTSEVLPVSVSRTSQNVLERTNLYPQTSSTTLQTVLNFGPIHCPQSQETSKSQRTTTPKKTGRKIRGNPVNNSNSITINATFSPLQKVPNNFTSTLFSCM